MPELWISFLENFLPVFKLVHETSSFLTFLLLCAGLLCLVIYATFGSFLLIVGGIELLVKRVQDGLRWEVNSGNLELLHYLEDRLKAMDSKVAKLEAELALHCADEKRILQHSSTVTVVPPNDSLQLSIGNKPASDFTAPKETVTRSS